MMTRKKGAKKPDQLKWIFFQIFSVFVDVGPRYEQLTPQYITISGLTSGAQRSWTLGNLGIWITTQIIHQSGMVVLTVILTIKKLRQEDADFQASLTSTARFCLSQKPKSYTTPVEWQIPSAYQQHLINPNLRNLREPGDKKKKSYFS